MAAVGKTDFSQDYEGVREQPFVVYAYIRKSDDVVMYVGVDKNGDKNRRKIEHEADSHVGKQKVNRLIQKNPERYYFEVLAICSDEDWMFDIEATLIHSFKAVGQCKFNVDQELTDDVLKAMEK